MADRSPPYESGPTWQDHNATREDIENAYRRIRIYLYERESDPEKRESVRHAAQREFLAGQGIDHPGLLVPRELLEHDMGPALVIDQRADAMRLDHYLVQYGDDLDLPARLGMIRQLAEAVSYAHDRRLVHRARKAGALRRWTTTRRFSARRSVTIWCRRARASVVAS